MKYNVFVYYPNYKIALEKVEEKELKKIQEAFENQDLYEYSSQEIKGKKTSLDMGKSNCVEFEPVQEAKSVEAKDVTIETIK